VLGHRGVVRGSRRGGASGLEVPGLGEHATGAATHPPALVVGYGTPPDSGFATAVNLLCAVLG
jgi:GntR family transcriptional regulator/MocR family aminotransferase